MSNARRLVLVAALAAAAFAPLPLAGAAAKERHAGAPAGNRRPRAYHAPRAPQAPHAPARRPAAPRNRGAQLAKKRVYRKGTPNGLPRPNLKPTVASLRATLGLLAKSELDYKGHRETAMRDVGSAILHLEPTRPGSPTPNPALAYTANGTAAGVGSKTTMTPATSDGYLREALRSLKKDELHLSISSVDARQGRALTSVQKAMKELETALALKP